MPLETLKKTLLAITTKVDEDGQREFRRWTRNIGERALFALGYIGLALTCAFVVYLHPISDQERIAGSFTYGAFYAGQTLLIWGLATVLIFGHEQKAKSSPRAFAFTYLVLSLVRISALFVLGIEIVILTHGETDFPTAGELAGFYSAIVLDLLTFDFLEFATSELVDSNYNWGQHEATEMSWSKAIIHIYKLSVFFCLIWAWHKWLYIDSQKEAQRLKGILADRDRNEKPSTGSST